VDKSVDNAAAKAFITSPFGAFLDLGWRIDALSLFAVLGFVVGGGFD
jgi:hypothetical protein